MGIAMARPTSLDALSDVHGMGKQRITKYGTPFVEAVELDRLLIGVGRYTVRNGAHDEQGWIAKLGALVKLYETIAIGDGTG